MSVDFVAEHIMGFERGRCRGTLGGGNATAYGCETWVWCTWCGAEIRNGHAGLCPKYPFPSFSLRDLMCRLGELGHSVMVRFDPLRESDCFTITLDSWRVGDTDDPFEALCRYLESRPDRVEVSVE